jgi:hypothetical protein
MPRLNMIVEGRTEELFVQEVISPALVAQEVWVSVRRVQTSVDKKLGRRYRGGLDNYAKARKDLLSWLKQDHDAAAFFTTMFDLYALPGDFPGFAEASRLGDPYRRIAALEDSLRQDVGDRRFIPYIQLHEFEALLLSDPSQFDWEFTEHAEAIGRLVALAAESESPELINDGNESAPSKRIIQAIPEYEARKASAGPLIAAKISLPVLRQKCPHFDEWMKKLEALK